MRLGIDFTKDFHGFWKGKWKQVGTKIDPKPISTQNSLRALRYWNSYYFFNGYGGPGPPKSIKNRSKKEVKMGRHLGIDFLRILVDFCTQVKTENARKIGPRQAKTGQDKGRQRKGREGRGKEERGRDWKGKRVAEDFLRPGGRGSPTL